MFFPFMDYKKVRLDFSGSVATAYTATSLSLVVFQPDASNHSGNIYISGGIRQQRLSSLDRDSDSVTLGALVLSPGESLTMSGVGGDEIHGYLHILELPEI